MADAEDVLLDAAGHVLRALGARRSRASSTPERSPRRFELWLLALYGRSWPVVGAAETLAPGWLARASGSLAPWERERAAHGATDGSRLYVPPTEDPATQLLLALHLGARLARASLDFLPDESLARDLYWAADGAVIDGWLAAELPGLRAGLARARRRALERRPASNRLSSIERVAEDSIRALLGQPVAVTTRAPPRPELLAQRAAREARALRRVHGGRYRGVAPVAPWGIARPELAAEPTARPVPAEPPRGLAARTLPRPLEPRALEAEEEQQNAPGAFVVSGQPHEALEDAAHLRRPVDSGGEGDLDALAEELAALGRAPTVRSALPVREILERAELRCDVRRGNASSDSPEGVHRYPEWDHRAGAYRQDACSVHEAPAPEGPSNWAERVLREHSALVRRLRRQALLLRPRRRFLPRQRDGEDLDLDACVEAHADMRAGGPIGDRVLRASLRREREVATALLVDASASTDGWVHGDRRVIDVARDAALVFGESLAALGDRSAVFAFSGRGPHGVRVRVVQSFGERWSASIRRRLGAIEPEGYTRLGAALRHVSARLGAEPARVRILLLLSDGRPDDEDVYEGRYGIEDTRQAVLEARRSQLRPFCLTIDREGSSYLPAMFGPFDYAILTDPARLPERTVGLYRRLAGA